MLRFPQNLTRVSVFAYNDRRDFGTPHPPRAARDATFVGRIPAPNPFGACAKIRSWRIFPSRGEVKTIFTLLTIHVYWVCLSNHLHPLAHPFSN
jgi:hypothetical protein